MTKRPQRLGRERGAVLVWFAVFLLLTLAMMGLGIDVAKLTTTRTMLQNAADAAALAGASAIDARTGMLDQMTATNRAQTTASHNKAYVNIPEPVLLDAADVTYPGNNRVRVTVRRTGGKSVVNHLLQVLGVPTIGMTATATAKAETVSVATCGVVPLAVSPSESDGGFVVGQTYELRGGSGTGTHGNYGAVDFPLCNQGECPGGPTSGAGTWSCLMANGYCCDLTIGQTVTTEPGSMTGPFQKAIMDRFDADTDPRGGISYAQYNGSGNRVVFVPVTTTLSGNGRSSVTITGFAGFFLGSRPTGPKADLSGEFIYAVLPGRAGTGPTGNAIAYAVRLVQ